MAASSKAVAVPRSGLLGLSVLAVVLAAGIGVLLWQAVELSSMAQVAARVDELKPIARGIRLALIGLVAALWPWLIGLANRAGRIGEQQRDDLLAQRWRLLGWLLVIELVLGQDLLGRFFAAITGAAGFATSPFDSDSNFFDPPSDILVYPDLNYTFSFNRNPHLYLRLSAGVYFAFDKIRDDISGKNKLEWQGDPIPGAGLTCGYAF